MLDQCKGKSHGSGIGTSCTERNFKYAEGIMTAREAIRILMLSPIYFQIPPSDRIQLIKEYCIYFVSIPEKKK